MLTWQQFEQVEMRAGTILEVHDFPKARNPAWQLHIDFGEMGIKKARRSSPNFTRKKKNCSAGRSLPW